MQNINTPWDINIPKLKNRDEIDKASQLINRDYNQLVESSLNLIQGKSDIKNEYEILGIYSPFSPKIGQAHLFIFITQKTQVVINTKKKTNEIESIDISANYMGRNVHYPINLSEFDFKKLQLNFSSTEIVGEGDTLSIKKIYSLNQNPNIEVIFINNYSNQSQTNCIGKMKFENDIKNIEKLEIFNAISIVNTKS